MESLVAGELTIQPSAGFPGEVRLDWLGKSSSPEPSKELRPYLQRALEQAKLEGSSLELHFEKLEQINASTVAEIIFLINAARESGTRVHLFYARNLEWQALSFQAIERAIRTFEVGGTPAKVTVIAADPS